MTKQPVLKGFTFRFPIGDLDYRVSVNVDAAQSNAVFDAGERSSIELPKDWDRAYEMGYRTVPATMTGGASNKAWQKWRREKP